MTVGSDPPTRPSIDHIIVLVLENRSFDHLLGWLDHPSPEFDGVASKTELGNRLDPRDRSALWVRPDANAEYVLPVDPDHEHYAVMGQLERVDGVSNAGFVASYAHKALNTAQHENRRRMLHTWARRLVWGGALMTAVTSPFAAWRWVGCGGGAAALGLAGLLFTRPRPPTADQQAKAKALAPTVMRGFAPERVPVLSRLAKEFALCQQWFCSVPGETWPNRNFFHAGSSSGTVNIELGFYRDRTIFEILDQARKSWRVYYGQLPPQVFFFPYVLERSIENSGSLRDLFHAIEHNELPNYAFVEPHHGLGGQRPSGSQHPGNNLQGKDDGSDFRGGERLIAEVYQRLAENDALFQKTVFIVTYDEHGGLYDHCRPPSALAAGERRDTLSRRLVRWVLARSSRFGFNFRRLGPRVPSLVISPWIPVGTLDSRIHDHSSVPRTVRKLFAPRARRLSLREAHAATIDELLTLEEPRTKHSGTDDPLSVPGHPLPDLRHELDELSDTPLFGDDITPVERPQTQFEWELLSLTDAINRGMLRQPRGTPVTARVPTRRAFGLGRPRRLRTMSTEQLTKLYDDTHFTLSVIAAEQLGARPPSLER